MFKSKRIIFWLMLGLWMPYIIQAQARPLDLSQQSYLRSDNLGFTFVAYLNNLDVDASTRYQQALSAGAGWTRWPLYWNVVETSPGIYNWGDYDRLVDADRAAGLQTNAILLGAPTFYGDTTSITGLYEPIFSDATDTPAFGKTINPGNKWAMYVYTAVSRYRPGGTLSRQLNWPYSNGIRVWEVWNEPDLELFWRGNYQDYARLLKVAYIAIKHADNSAQVMFGGLAYGDPDTEDWLKETLAIIQQDPDREQFNWYFDLVGLHSYTDARRTGFVVSRMKTTLFGFGIDRPIWLNETGMSVWDDYPGPTWAAGSVNDRPLRGTMEQQAAFVLQSATYAFAAGADKVFFHQLYDDCGDSGGDFPPDSGQSGDAFGFYRNPTYAECFSQHPNPMTPRPAIEAFKTLAQVFGNGSFGGGEIIARPDGSVFVRFTRPNQTERITVMWNNLGIDNTIQWTADSGNARVYTYPAQQFNISPQGENYTVTLPAARFNDDPRRNPIGSQTFILVEQVSPEQIVMSELAIPPVITPRAPLPAQVGSILGGNPDSENSTIGSLTQDTTPPITGMAPLPETSPTTFTVRWNGADTGGIRTYLVWVRVNGGEWEPWLETTATSADYVGIGGATYEFVTWAQDNAGNWSLNTDLSAQAVTRVE